MSRIHLFTMLVTLFLVSNIFMSINARGIFRCPQKDIETGCLDPKMCIYPDPYNCNGFIQCTDGGVVFRKNCNRDLEWNERIKNCDEPKRSTCGSR